MSKGLKLEVPFLLATCSGHWWKVWTGDGKVKCSTDNEFTDLIKLVKEAGQVV